MYSSLLGNGTMHKPMYTNLNLNKPYANMQNKTKIQNVNFQLTSRLFIKFLILDILTV